jgi:hypothetical protein
MKLLNLCAFATLFSHVRPSLITTKKICRDCIHFIGEDNQCRKFGDTNLVTGKVTYRSATSVRENEKECGENAIHFEENNFKIITVPYYFLKYNWLAVPMTGIMTLYFFAVYISIHK